MLWTSAYNKTTIPARLICIVSNATLCRRLFMDGPCGLLFSIFLLLEI